MKKIITLSVMITLIMTVFAQVPQKISYQAVIRNTSGGLITNHAVGMKVSILHGSAGGTVVYQEIFNPNPETNANGLVSLEIGTGLPITGTFSSINWAAGPYWLKTEADPAGGTSYTIIGTSQILSVPYALYSRSSETIADNSVTSVKIVDGAVANVDLANSSVNSAKIADGTISTSDLADNSITSSKIVDATITSADLATGSVTTDKISNAAVTGAKIAQMGATTGQILKWTGTTWDNAADNTGPWMESDLYIYNSSAKKFGIGTNSPSRKVTIVESGTEAYLNIQNSSTGYTLSDGILIGMQGVNGWLTTYENGCLNIGTNNTMKMIIEAGGNVGIGTTDPGYKLQVGNYSDGSQARANAWNVFSDVNLKRDLTRLTNPLAMVEKLTGYYFFWKTGIDQSRQVGFSAQEVREVLPEVVSEGEDGYFSIEYSKMVPLLLEAIKEQQKQLDELKQLVKNLMQK